MKDFLQILLSSSQFIPHGHCYLWKPELVGLHLVSDSLIALAYYSIPIALIYFVRKRQDVPFNRLFLLFSAFIVACGTTHLMDVWTLWHSAYWLSGLIKATTAIISVYTALVLISILPQALALPTPAQLEVANRELRREVAERQQAEAALQKARGELELRVADRTAELAISNQELRDAIAEHQKTEVALRESEAKFRMFLNSASEAVIVSNANGEIIVFNAKAEELFGYSSTEIVGHSVECLMPERYRQGHVQFRRDYQTRPVQRSMGKTRHLYALRKDGSEFPIEAGLSTVQISGEPFTLIFITDITERQQTEAALRESEATLRLFAKYAPAGIAMLDTHLCYVLASQRWVEDYQINSVEEIIGRSHYEIFPEIPERWRQIHQRALAGAIERCEEDLFERADASQQWIRWEVRPWHTTTQEIGGIILFSEDITERKQAEANLREGEERLRLALTAANQGLFDANVQTGDVIVNPSYATMLGYDPVDFQESAADWVERLHPDDREQATRLYREYVAGEVQEYRSEFRLKTSSGNWKWVLSIGKILAWDEEGQPLRMLGTHTDISDRKQAEAERLQTEKLQMELQLLEKVLEVALAGYWDWDIPGDQEYLSPTFKRMFGYADHELPNTPATWQNLIFAEDLPGVLECFDLHVQSRGQVPYYNEVRYHHKDGSTVWVICSGQVIEWDATGNPLRMVGCHLDITERKQAEIQLQASEAELRAIFAAMNDTIVVRDREGRCLKIAPNSSNLYRDPPEMLGRTMHEVFPRAEADLVLTKIHQCLDQQTTTSAEYCLPIQERLVHFLASISPLSQDTALIVARDISDRKQAEAALQRAYDELSQQAVQLEQTNRTLQDTLEELQITEEELHLQNDQLVSAQALAEAERHRYQDLFNFAPDGYVVTDGNGLIQEANQAIAALVGVDQASLVNTLLRTWIAKFDRPALTKLISRLNQQNKSQKLQTDAFSLKSRRGDAIPVAMTVTTIHNPQQQIVNMRWLIQDITQRKQTEQALAQYTREVEDLYNNAPCGYHSLDDAGRFLNVNETELHWLGYSRAELIGKPFPDFITEAGRTVFEQSYPQFKERGWIRDVEFDLICKDGSLFPVLISATAVKNEDGNYLYSRTTLFDRRDRKQAEEQLRISAERISLANAELSRAARLKDEFLAGMSHELRTPLNAVLGMSEVLLEEIHGSLTSEQRESVALIEHSGNHLLSLINDILDLAKVESGKMTLEISSVSVQQLCDTSLSFIKQQAYQKHIHLRCTVDEGIGEIELDDRRMGQVLINLLSNAVKFTPEGGRIQLSVRADRAQETVEFAISDTGIGIAPDQIDKLFQPFVQLDSSLSRNYGGTGLGLALVRRIVELHGGSVTLESAVGQGSCFTVVLPWQRENQAQSVAVPFPLTDATAVSIQRALIIEDSESAANQISRYLTELEAATIVHPLGQGVIDLALQVKPDVIILDILLPDLPGWDVLMQLKAHPLTSTIPVLLVSVVDERAKGLALGAADYLLKPITRLQLQQALNRIMGMPEHEQTTALVAATPEWVEAPLIVLAEDNEANIEVLLNYLQAHGLRTAIARNGLEAVQLVQQCHPDLVLMDIQMPEMDGLEATRRIRADPNLANLPIIALTALAMPGDRERCLTAGANEYLTKPVSLKQLLQLIKQYLPDWST